MRFSGTGAGQRTTRSVVGVLALGGCRRFVLADGQTMWRSNRARRRGQLVIELYGHPAEAGARARLIAARDAQAEAVPIQSSARRVQAA
jgi:hypothetical protein